MRGRYKNLLDLRKEQFGFTIVELLIVIVVVGILAAVTVVAYGGISGRAYDTAVQNDLDNIAKKMKLYNAEYGVYPVTAQLSGLGLKVAKSAYGGPSDISHYYNGSSYYNFVYCRMPATNPTAFALVAFSRTGNGFQYTSGGALGKYTGTKNGSIGICADAGVNITGSERDWLFDSNAWQSFVGS